MLYELNAFSGGVAVVCGWWVCDTNWQASHAVVLTTLLLTNLLNHRVANWLLLHGLTVMLRASAVESVLAAPLNNTALHIVARACCWAHWAAAAGFIAGAALLVTLGGGWWYLHRYLLNGNEQTEPQEHVVLMPAQMVDSDTDRLDHLRHFYEGVLEHLREAHRAGTNITVHLGAFNVTIPGGSLPPGIPEDELEAIAPCRPWRRNALNPS